MTETSSQSLGLLHNHRGMPSAAAIQLALSSEGRHQQQQSYLPGCSRKQGEKYFFLFSPLSSILFIFPLHLSFLLYGLILSNISPMALELVAVTTVIFQSCSLLLTVFPYMDHCLQSRAALLALFTR